LLMALKL